MSSSEYEDSDGGPTEKLVDKFALHNAAEQGDEVAIKELLFVPSKEGGLAEPNPLCKQLFSPKDVLGCNPLHVAILHGNVSCAQQLLIAGIDPSTRCDSSSPLHLAASLAMHAGKQEQALQLVQLLLQHGAQCLDKDDCGRTALHWVAVVGLAGAVAPLVTVATEEQERQVAAYKAAAAADETLNLPDTIDHLAEMEDNDGHTALALAARHGSVDIITQLLEKGMPWNTVQMCKVRDRDGHTAFHLATLHNHPAALQALLASGPASQLAQQDRKGRTALQLAALRGHQKVVAVLEAAKAQQQAKADAKQAPSPAKQTSAPKAVAAPVQAADALPNQAAPDGSKKRPWPCILIAPDECFLHRTAPEPYRRGSSAPPPENVHRLRVLTVPGFGVLRGREFSGLAWRTSGTPCATMTDVLRCHEWAYLRQLGADCNQIEDALDAVGSLDNDTAICHHSYFAALKAAGACCQAVDDVLQGKARTAFCAVRPPGHHAGPLGVVHNANDPHGSHGFCLLSNIAIAAGYAMSTYRHQGIKRVAILDFDVHHGNGTEAVVANVVPTVRKVPFQTPFANGFQHFPTFKPWLDVTDKDNILFASVQGYGRHPMCSKSWFYPGSGATVDTQPPSKPTQPTTTEAAEQPQSAPVKAENGRGDVEMRDATSHQAAVTGVTGKGAAVTQLFPEDPDREFVGSTLDKGGEGAGDQAGPGGPRIINVGVPGPGAKRQLWRRAWRDKILPAVANFRPDMIFVSAGFDAHKKDHLNHKYVGITEDEYEWVTDQIKQVANRFCSGRVVSVLEGGYNIQGGPSSVFARSVAAHVRILAEPHTQAWDPAESQAERDAEARRREAAAAAQAEAAAAAAAAEAAAAAATAAAEAAEAARAAVDGEDATAATATASAAATDGGGGGRVKTARDETEDTEMVVAASGAAGAEAGPSGAGGAGGRSKRARRGEPVDYVALNAKMEAEKAAGPS